MTDTPSIVDAIVAGLSHERLDGYEIYMDCSSGLTIEVKDGATDIFIKSDNAGVGLRVSKEERPGFAFSTELSPRIVSDLVQQAVHGAKGADPDPYVRFPMPPTMKPSKLDQFDHGLQKISVGDKIETACSLEAAARSSDSRVKKVRKAAYVETTGSVTVCNHTGLRLSYRKTLVSGSIMVVAEDGKDAEIGWDYDFSPFFDQLKMDSIGATAARRAVSMLGGRPIRSMEVPAVLPPWVASDLLRVLSQSFMADNLQKGKSMLFGRSGERVFSSHLTIVDDGLYPEGIASSPFDDEGSLRERTVLVSEGVI